MPYSNKYAVKKMLR